MKMGLLSVIILTDCSDRGAYLSEGAARGQQRWGLGDTERTRAVKCNARRKLLEMKLPKQKLETHWVELLTFWWHLVAFRVTYEQVRPRRLTPRMRLDKYSSCQTINSTYTTQWSSLSIGLTYIYIFLPWSPASTLIYSNENCKTP